MNENNKCFQRKDCRICRSENLEKVIELTPTPPGNNFLDYKSLTGGAISPKSQFLQGLFSYSIRTCSRSRVSFSK